MKVRVLVAVILWAGATAPALVASSPADDVRGLYHRQHASRLVPLLTEALRFPTVKGNVEARDDQQAWLRRIATQLGLAVRDAGLVTEIELPGPQDAPVIGLLVLGPESLHHGIIDRRPHAGDVELRQVGRVRAHRVVLIELPWSRQRPNLSTVDHAVRNS